MLLRKDRIDEETGEQRWHAIGQVQAPRGIVASKNGEEIIRILSAREAGNPHQ